MPTAVLKVHTKYLVPDYIYLSKFRFDLLIVWSSSSEDPRDHCLGATVYTPLVVPPSTYFTFYCCSYCTYSTPTVSTVDLLHLQTNRPNTHRHTNTHQQHQQQHTNRPARSPSDQPSRWPRGTPISGTTRRPTPPQSGRSTSGRRPPT